MGAMKYFLIIAVTIFFASEAYAQIGKRFPSEKKVIKDPVTGTMLTFLTSTPIGDSKIYQTHNQWTSDGQWLIFRSNRAKNEATSTLPSSVRISFEHTTKNGRSPAKGT